MKTLMALLLCAGLFLASATAHESDGYKHAVGKIGPCIGGRYCGGLSQVWKIDKDGDGIVDDCLHIIYTHEKTHIKSLPITNGECLCP